MNDSQTNPPAVTEPAPTSSPGVDNSEKAPKNPPRADAAITSALNPQSSPSPPPSKAFEIFTWIKHTIAAQTHLSDVNIAVAAFWVISTWFQEALTVFPCLAITGPAHEATELLRVLDDLCNGSLLLAGFRRGDLNDLRCRTLLISEPNLTNQNAALLGNLTNRGFMIVAQGSSLYCHSSKAIYIGDDPKVKRIQHSIYIDVTPALDEEKGIPPERVLQNIKYLVGHLTEYRKTNLDQVRRLAFNPMGVSSETGAIAKALGSCIVDTPELQEKLVALLKAQDQQRLSQRSDSTEAVVIEAALTLSRQEREHIYVREIAVVVNRLVDARGEGSKLSPEKVGHRLRRLGLPTRRLSQAGNGLVMDKETITRLQTLSEMYVGEDLLAENENLHCSQAIEKKEVEEVM